MSGKRKPSLTRPITTYYFAQSIDITYINISGGGRVDSCNQRLLAPAVERQRAVVTPFC